METLIIIMALAIVILSLVLRSFYKANKKQKSLLLRRREIINGHKEREYAYMYILTLVAGSDEEKNTLITKIANEQIEFNETTKNAHRNTLEYRRNRLKRYDNAIAILQNLDYDYY